MSKKSKQSTKTASESGQFAGATGDNLQNRASSEYHVTPTSERIIRKTSAKRREAMKVLADR